MSLAIPTTLPGGQQAWLDSETVAFTEALRELSPNLALFREADRGWSIWEVCRDGKPRMVCRSKPDAKLGPEVIQRLREHDSHSRANGNVVERMIAHNDKLIADRGKAILEKQAEAMHYAAWHLAKGGALD